MLTPVARMLIRWLKPTDGGRKQLPPGPIYAATAYFSGDPLESMFSVVLRWTDSYVSNHADEMTLDLSLPPSDLVPELAHRLVPEAQLFITEGARTVAEGKVLSVRSEHWLPPFAN